MKIENLYEKAYIKKLKEALEETEVDPSFGEPEMSEMPPEQPEGAPTDEPAIPDGNLGTENGGKAFSDLKSYLDTLPQDGQISNQQIIDLAQRYAKYFEEVKNTIRELQNKQLANEFEDCLHVKFLPLSKALSNMIDELQAGVSDRVQTKNEKAAKENGASLEM